ncbi:hypothetical protein DCAR_0205290 [Daucus carota subsp. sativus]|uniref:Uncharacterized protein n=1 Tax=Daucus carota subsp. sativus TaxID=79200 RepID=A0AAF0WA08_DAUCS|nr:hypothetical protein DCAR_0205290 [Daucus carota subsp. sativus]
MKEDFLEKSIKNKLQAEKMETRYRKACLGYARIREKIIQEKTEKGEKDPIVTRLDAWEYARRNVNDIVDDPVAVQLLKDVRKGFSPGMQSQGSSHMDNFDMDNNIQAENEVNHNVVAAKELPQTPLTITNNKKVISENDKCDMNPKKKLEDKHKEKTVKSNAGVSSRPLGYPLRGDVCHDGVLDIVRLAIKFEPCTDIEVYMGPHWDGDPWIEHINKENVLEVLNGQWLSSSSICFYIMY